MIAVLERLIEQNQRQPALIAAALVEALKGLNLREEIPVVQSSGQTGQAMDTPVTIVIDGESYSSPKLMMVIEWLKNNPDKVSLTVREIAALTGVSKSWVAIAKKYKESTSAPATGGA